MVHACCPECDGDIILNPTPKVGRALTCPHCGADLEVIGMDPVELDWAYEESDEDWRDDES